MVDVNITHSTKRMSYFWWSRWMGEANDEWAKRSELSMKWAKRSYDSTNRSSKLCLNITSFPLPEGKSTLKAISSIGFWFKLDICCWDFGLIVKFYRCFVRSSKLRSFLKEGYCLKRRHISRRSLTLLEESPHFEAGVPVQLFWMVAILNQDIKRCS